MFSRRKKNQDTDTRNQDTRDVGVKVSGAEVKEFLRTVGHDETFYFYEDVGRPLGYVAKGLVDFRDKVNVVRWSSLVFHLKRKDFQNWISDTIGDSELAKRISNLSPHDLDLRKKLHATIDTRIKELKQTQPTPPTTIPQDLLITPRIPETELPK